MLDNLDNLNNLDEKDENTACSTVNNEDQSTEACKDHELVNSVDQQEEFYHFSSSKGLRSSVGGGLIHKLQESRKAARERGVKF